MTAKALPAASQAPLWGMSNNSAGAVLALPGASGSLLDRPDQMPAAPDPAGSYWLAFTGDHDEGDAARCFLRRYGQLPRYCFDGLGGLLLVGPVPGLEGGAT
jgi:hypothetical protein